MTSATPRRARAAICLTLAAATAGCGRRAPEGQIVASVNGDDITTHDLDQIKAQLPAGARVDRTVRNQLVATLVDARLLVQEAQREGLAKTPEYLDEKRQAEDQILIRLLNTHVLQTLQPVSPGAVDGYLEAHPARFSGREIIRLDQVRFDLSAAALAALSKVDTLAEAEAALKAANVRYQRGTVTVDTLTLTDLSLNELNALPPGKLLGDKTGAVGSVSQILDRTPKPLAANEAREAATAILQRNAAVDALGALQTRLRQSAEVAYQKGYGPAPVR